MTLTTPEGITPTESDGVTTEGRAQDEDAERARRSSFVPAADVTVEGGVEVTEHQGEHVAETTDGIKEAGVEKSAQSTDYWLKLEILKLANDVAHTPEQVVAAATLYRSFIEE